MKRNAFIVIIIAILFTACTPQVPTQEIEVNTKVPTATFTAEATVPPTLTATLEPTPTKKPTITPTQTPLGCVTLLSPADEVQLPAIGMVTFSWEPMHNATFYLLSIILPSGAITSFETRLTSRDQFMEAFPAAGQYRWKVAVQDRKKTEICSSKFATFSKSYYEPPREPNTKDRNRR